MKTAALTLVLLLSATAAAAQPVEKAGTGQTRTLADVARERRAGVQGVTGGTFSVAGASGMPVLTRAVYGEGGSFEEADRNDAAHRPAPAPVAYVFDPYWPNFYPSGYSQRTHYRTHTAPAHRAPVISRPAIAPAPAAPRNTSGLSTASRRTR